MFSSIFGLSFIISSLFFLLIPLSETEPSKAPTSTTEPSLELIFVNTPDIGDGTSKLTLSVSSSTIGSSTSTVSPSFLSHLETVASVILSPSTGTKIFFDQYEAKCIGRKDNFFIVEFAQSPSDIFKDIGHVPLPPYINRNDEEIDKERYATVYENKDFQSSVAAPTAGLHFDNELMQKINNIGVETISINLSVGAGTFQPVKAENIKDHKIHKEFVEVSDEIVDKVKQAKNNGKKIFAVGTTTLRAIETAFIEEKGYKGFTDLFIYPGFKFKAVDMLITNFHLPKSSLLMLVSAFIGFENTKKIYDVAVQEKYRFLSYGDAMLLKKK